MWYEQPLLLKALLSWHTDGLQASFLGTEDWRCAVLCCGLLLLSFGGFPWSPPCQ